MNKLIPYLLDRENDSVIFTCRGKMATTENVSPGPPGPDRPSIIKYLRSSDQPKVEFVSGLLKRERADPNGLENEMPPIFYCVKYIFWSDTSKPKKIKALQDIFPMLIQNGADVNKKYKKVPIICYLHSHRGYLNNSAIPEIVNFLLPYGLDLNSTDVTHNYYPNLMNIIFFSNYDIMNGNVFEYMKYLIQNGLSVSGVNARGETILHYHYTKLSYDTWYQKIFTFLIQNGLDVNARDNEGRTTLHLCLKLKDWDNGNGKLIVDFLFNHGANPYIRDNKGKRPIDYKICPRAPEEVIERVKKIRGEIKLFRKTYTLGRLFQQKQCGIIVMYKIFTLRPK